MLNEEGEAAVSSSDVAQGPGTILGLDKRNKMKKRKKIKLNNIIKVKEYLNNKDER